jgi:hypothetical protein
MTTSEIAHQTGPITATVTLDQATADLLRQSATPSLVVDHTYRFEVLGTQDATMPRSTPSVLVSDHVRCTAAKR